jgi:hypothetical protein
VAGEVTGAPEGMPIVVSTSGRNAEAVLALRSLSSLEANTEYQKGSDGLTVILTPPHGWSGMGSGTQHLWRILLSLCEPDHPVDLFVALAHLDPGNLYAVMAAFAVMAGAANV